MLEEFGIQRQTSHIVTQKEKSSAKKTKNQDEDSSNIETDQEPVQDDNDEEAQQHTVVSIQINNLYRKLLIEILERSKPRWSKPTEEALIESEISQLTQSKLEKDNFNYHFLISYIYVALSLH